MPKTEISKNSKFLPTRLQYAKLEITVKFRSKDERKEVQRGFKNFTMVNSSLKKTTDVHMPLTTMIESGRATSRAILNNETISKHLN